MPNATIKDGYRGGNLPLVLIACDTRGHMSGGGGITPTITGDHNNRVTDYTTIVVIENEHNKLPNTLGCTEQTDIQH